MRNILCFVIIFSFVSCSNSVSSGGKQSSKRSYREAPAAYKIEGVQAENGSLSEMVKRLENHFKVSNLLSSKFGSTNESLHELYPDGYKVSSSQDTGLKLYKLENCQAMAVAALIANGIPVLFETTFNQDLLVTKTYNRVFALFNSYKIVANTAKVGDAALGNDKMVVYLEYNLNVPGRVTRNMSKQRVDFGDLDLSVDLFEAADTKKFAEMYKNSSFVAKEESQIRIYESVVPPRLTIDKMYIYVPSEYTEKDLAEIFEAGLGNLDFSYKTPELRRLN
ncbi:MAG: hypothetical protein JNL74_12845 [Fibrobacteres bacterium]|nr:hypothetical protein [Fibrobacterota bacterium]